MTALKLPPVVAVDWVDSASYHGWQGDDAVQAVSPTTISSVGFLHAETRQHVTLSAHCVHDTNSDRAHGPLSIPKCAILRRRTLFK